MARAHARAITCGPRVRLLADRHLTFVIFTAAVGMPEIGPVIPGIENRHQSGGIRRAVTTCASVLAQSGSRGAGGGVVMTGDAGAGMGVINAGLCGPVMSWPV